MTSIISAQNRQKKIWLILFCATGIFAVFRMFLGIGGDFFTFLDEYQSFDVAAGFYHTGKFYFWDFHHQALSEERYTRAWPHTLLLSLWFRIFGVTVAAGKALSALFGVLFILSLFYITMKIYHNYYTTLLSCLFAVTNSTVITVFRQIRMYGLWLLCTLWLAYYVYRLLTVMPQRRWIVKESGLIWHVCRFWRDNLDFSVGYILSALGMLILSCSVHINTLAMGVGMILFYLYLLVFAGNKERKKYRNGLMLAGAIALIALTLVGILGFCGVIREIGLWDTLCENISWREEINGRYWLWTLDFVHNERFFWFALVCLLTAFVVCVKEKGSDAYQFSIYLTLITVSSLFCFLYLLSRYYQARYMLYVAPMIAILMAWGIAETCRGVQKIFFWIWHKEIKWMSPLLCAACTLVMCMSIYGQYTEVYENPGICRHRQVYEIVKKDAEEKYGVGTIPILGFDFRDYYGAQVFPDYETAVLDRKNDPQIWQEFAERYPDGYILVESAKINGFPEVMKRFIQDYSERIAGEGLDTYNIEAVRYHVLSPTVADRNKEVLEKEEPYAHVENAENRIKIMLTSNKLEADAEMVFIGFQIKGGVRDGEPIFYQLRLPKWEKDKVYSYEAVMPENSDKILLNRNCMIYCKNGSVMERAIY